MNQGNDRDKIWWTIWFSFVACATFLIITAIIIK